jgi:hypothetical protein
MNVVSHMEGYKRFMMVLLQYIPEYKMTSI